MDKKLITCPHCLSEIPKGANICRGCRAEISYGTPGIMMFLLFIVPIVISLFISSILNAVGFSGFAKIKMIIEICACIAMWFYAIKWSFKKYKDRISFERIKNK